MKSEQMDAGSTQRLESFQVHQRLQMSSCAVVLLLYVVVVCCCCASSQLCDQKKANKENGMQES